jgi:hypothetical protein
MHYCDEFSSRTTRNWYEEEILRLGEKAWTVVSSACLVPILVGVPTDNRAKMGVAVCVYPGAAKLEYVHGKHSARVSPK